MSEQPMTADAENQDASNDGVVDATIQTTAEAAESEAAEANEAQADEVTSEAAESAEAASEETSVATEEAAEVAAEATEEVAEAAAEATEEVAEAASEATEEVSEAAAEVTEEAAEAASEATEEVVKAAAEASADEAAAAEGEAPKVKVEEIESEEMIQLRAAMEAKLSLEGQVIGWNKGGYHVALGKIAAFCPVSQIEIGNPRSPKKYLDKTFQFRIIEIQEGGRRVVVSRATALKAKRAEEAAKVREVLKKDAVLDGRVSSITDFGAFVNLGANIEGLVHVSEVSRQRVEHAKEVLKVGQKVKVQVLKIEKNGKRISLSMKRLEKDPWDGVAERFTSGGAFKGKIARVTEFGLFVEVEPGLEGLVHTSRLPLGAKLEEDENLAVGQEIEGWVHDVDRKRRRLSLSLRPVAEGNPWKDVEERFPEGDMFEGKVEKVTKFGVFIELEPGLTGLLPFAVLGGGGVSNPKRQFQPGKPVKVKVLSVDTGRKRISLGTEQSKAEGSDKDFKNYVKSQRKSESGLGALAQAFAKVKGQISAQ